MRLSWEAWKQHGMVKKVLSWPACRVGVHSSPRTAFTGMEVTCEWTMAMDT